MKISELPQEVKELALQYRKKDTDNLWLAFIWQNTKEGYGYWSDWYIKEFKNFNVEGWYRYNNGDEKDFITKTIVAESPAHAIEIFIKEFEHIHFFKIEITK